MTSSHLLLSLVERLLIVHSHYIYSGAYVPAVVGVANVPSDESGCPQPFCGNNCPHPFVGVACPIIKLTSVSWRLLK